MRLGNWLEVRLSRLSEVEGLGWEILEVLLLLTWKVFRLASTM